jgi:hypothetical protein
MTVFWDDAVIALMMEAESTSETSINFYQTTRRNIPHIHIRLLENLNSHSLPMC